MDKNQRERILEYAQSLNRLCDAIPAPTDETDRLNKVITLQHELERLLTEEWTRISDILFEAAPDRLAIFSQEQAETLRQLNQLKGTGFCFHAGRDGITLNAPVRTAVRSLSNKLVAQSRMMETTAQFALQGPAEEPHAGRTEVLISWSGEASHRVAEALRDWLEVVLPPIAPWLSSRDIPKGMPWLHEIFKELDKAYFGIFCVVPQNQNEPWLNFEAGAISKSIKEAHLMPLLVGMRASELHGPLSMFQATEWRKDDVLALAKSLNNALGRDAIDPLVLSRRFNDSWDSLNHRVSAVETNEGSTGATRRANNKTYTRQRNDFRRRALAARNLSLTRDAVDVLVELSAGQGTIRSLAERSGLHDYRVEHAIDELSQRGLVGVKQQSQGGDAWAVLHIGKAALVEQNLI